MTTQISDSGILFNDQTTIGSAYNLGPRNKIINGGMVVDQRNSGAAQTITAGTGGAAFTVDRWYGYCLGANVTGQQVSGTAPNRFNYRFTGAASVTKIGFAQRIEAVNCQDLAGNSATLAVDLANSLLTTVTWTAWYANTNDNFGTVASPARTQIATGTFTVSSTLTRYNAQISVPSAATTGIEVEFSVAAQTSGTWTIGRAQLEVGSTATPFEQRDYGDVLRQCQRYTYAITTTAAQVPLVSAANYASTNGYGVLPFPITMRAAPSVSFVNAANWNITFSGTVVAVTLTQGNATPYSTEIIGTGTGLTVGAAGWFRSNGVSTNQIILSSEL